MSWTSKSARPRGFGAMWCLSGWSTLKNHFDDTRPKDDSSYHTSSDPFESICNRLPEGVAQMRYSDPAVPAKVSAPERLMQSGIVGWTITAVDGPSRGTTDRRNPPSVDWFQVEGMPSEPESSLPRHGLRAHLVSSANG